MLIGAALATLVARLDDDDTSSQVAPYVPPCPSPSYGASGNIAPLFCKIVNPLALEFYRPIVPHLFALGQDASPLQVEAALHTDSRQATIPELCSAYQLWAYRWGWKFGTDPVASVTGAPCI